MTAEIKENYFFFSLFFRLFCFPDSGSDGMGCFRCRDNPFGSGKQNSCFITFNLVNCLWCGQTLFHSVAYKW